MEHGSAQTHSDSAFRFLFSETSLAGFEAAATDVTRGTAYRPGYLQIYCEGAAMRQMGLQEPFDRLAVFFNFLALDRPGTELPQVEAQVRQAVLNLISNSRPVGSLTSSMIGGIPPIRKRSSTAWARTTVYMSVVLARTPAAQWPVRPDTCVLSNCFGPLRNHQARVERVIGQNLAGKFYGLLTR